MLVWLLNLYAATTKLCSSYVALRAVRYAKIVSGFSPANAAYVDEAWFWQYIS